MMIRTHHVRPFGTSLILLGLMFVLSGCGIVEQTPPPSGELTISTRPEGAGIIVNGEPKGTSPLTITGLPSGPLLVEARRTGHRTAYETINMFDGQRVAHEFTLEPLRALLLVESDPVGAEVVIDDAFRGTTPLLLHNLSLGSHRIRLQAEGHFPREVPVTLDDRTPRLISVDLVSDTAALVVRSSPAGATLRIDGASYGTTPARAERVRTGEVLVELHLDGFLPYQREIRLRSGEEFRVDAQMVPLPSGLTTYTTPAGARVYINDQYQGDSPLTLTNLAVGAYTIRVQKRGYHSQTRPATLESGASRVEEFRLEPNSGTITLVTEPAGVQVFLNNENMGTTESDESDVISKPMTINMVEEGEHRLHLTRPGYNFRPRTIRIQANQVLSLHEKLNRLFIPNTRVRTGTRPADVYTGLLVERHPNGDVSLETRPGIIVTIPADEILRVEPIRSQ